MVTFCLRYGEDLLKCFDYQVFPEINQGFAAMQNWLDGKVNFHPVRNASFALNRQIRDEKDRVRKRFYQTISQLLASSHVNTIASGKQTLQ
ncbi:putative immunity protein [Streptococcus ferus]|uniref:putative immunity protein n=1 Tax=Streptococcus ferus TaxID=1345 RepID=UPI003515B0F1